MRQWTPTRFTCQIWYRYSISWLLSSWACGGGTNGGGVWEAHIIFLCPHLSNPHIQTFFHSLRPSPRDIGKQSHDDIFFSRSELEEQVQILIQSISISLCMVQTHEPWAIPEIVCMLSSQKLPYDLMVNVSHLRRQYPESVILQLTSGYHDRILQIFVIPQRVYYHRVIKDWW